MNKCTSEEYRIKELRIKMKRLYANLICLFVPSRKIRHKIKKKLVPDWGRPYKDIVFKIHNLPDPVLAWKNFVNGLDDDSAVTASRSLATVYSEYSRLSEILTPCEYSNFMENKIKLKTGIFRLSDDCYAFGKDLLPINRFESAAFCARHGLDTIDLSKVPQDAVVVDAGAFIGDSALIFRKYLNNKIYSFEPMKVNYEFLLKTIELNDMGDQVVPIKSALSDGKTKIYAHATDKVKYKSSGLMASDSGFRTSNTPSGDVLPSDTLDNFVEKNGLKVGLIKADVEGGEQSLLCGAKETISRDKPILLISIYHSWSDLDYFKVKEMIELWDIGYKFRVFKQMDDSVLAETLLICEQQ